MNVSARLHRDAIMYVKADPFQKNSQTGEDCLHNRSCRNASEICGFLQVQSLRCLPRKGWRNLLTESRPEFWKANRQGSRAVVQGCSRTSITIFCRTMQRPSRRSLITQVGGGTCFCLDQEPCNNLKGSCYCRFG